MNATSNTLKQNAKRLLIGAGLAIALPLARALVHRLALAAGRRDPSTRTAKTLFRADSAVTAVSRRAARTTASIPTPAKSARKG